MKIDYDKAFLWSVEMIEKPNPDTNLNSEVQVIRDILLGGHFEKFQAHVEALERELGALKKENKTLLKEIKELTARMDQMAGERDQSEQALRKEYDAQIKELNNRLNDFEKKQGGLISSLAKELSDYGHNSRK